MYACQEKIERLLSTESMLRSSMEHVGTIFQAVSAFLVVDVSSFLGDVCKLIQRAECRLI